MILIKAAILFLLFMVGIAIWGRFRKPKRRGAFCPHCGRPRIGSGRCPCGKA